MARWHRGRHDGQRERAETVLTSAEGAAPSGDAGRGGARGCAGG